jgi:type IV fimbrial biogenesis protein FimT
VNHHTSDLLGDTQMKKQQAGFTIIELVIVVAIAAIITSAGIPAMDSMIKNNRLKSGTFTLINDIQFARSEAAKRRQTVVMCRSADPLAAVPTCGGTNYTWTSGYLIFSTTESNSTYEAASANDTLLRVVGAVDKVDIMTNSNANNHLVINSDGTLNEAGAGIYAICDDRPDNGKYGRLITVPLHGRPYVEYGSDTAAGIDCTPAS